MCDYERTDSDTIDFVFDIDDYSRSGQVRERASTRPGPCPCPCPGRKKKEERRKKDESEIAILFE
jgi:hypothetical protein